MSFTYLSHLTQSVWPLLGRCGVLPVIRAPFGAGGLLEGEAAGRRAGLHGLTQVPASHLTSQI